MRTLTLSISPHDWIERDRRVITSEKQRQQFIDRAVSDMKEGSPQLYIVEFPEDMNIRVMKIS